MPMSTLSLHSQAQSLPLVCLMPALAVVRAKRTGPAVSPGMKNNITFLIPDNCYAF